MTAVHVAVVALGVIAVTGTLGSAVRTVMLPRAIPSRIARSVFVATRVVFRARAGRSPSYERQDRVLALYGPASLLVLLSTWILVVVAGYMAMLWGLRGGHRSARAAFDLSGSSVFTLGFSRPRDLPSTVLVMSEAAIGLFLLALLITYLPSIYAAFSRREALVASLEVPAGSPPSPAAFIERLWKIRGLGDLSDLWQAWNRWFIELQETHVTFPAVVFFRSPLPEHSWAVAAGAVLDTASVLDSTLDRADDPEARLMLRAGWLSLRRIASYFGLPHDVDPRPTDPISIERHEFDTLCDHLAQAGVALKPDRDQAWRDFAGWRVNYDKALIELCRLTVAPPAPWSSDRLYRQSRWWRP